MQTVQSLTRMCERKGLINLDKKQGRENNYKEYPEQVLERLLLIKIIKGFGFTINEIDTLLELGQTEDSLCNVMDTFDNKVTQLMTTSKGSQNCVKGLLHRLLNVRPVIVRLKNRFLPMLRDRN